MLKAKVIGAAVLLLVVIIAGLVITNQLKTRKISQLEEKLDIALGEINNLKVKETVNVASSGAKEELGKAKASVAGTGTKDRDNLGFVPDSAILMQLQSDPF